MSASLHDSPVSIVESSLDYLRQHIEANPGTLYAVLDACDEPRVPEKVGELADRAVSLYRGSAERDYWALAPYLVVVDTELLDWIAEHLWGDPWGIFVITEADLPALRKHFRRFLIVLGPNGNQLYFRFYDPRVLGSFLEACTDEEAEQIFGAVMAFLVQAEDETLSIVRLNGANTPLIDSTPL